MAASTVLPPPPSLPGNVLSRGSATVTRKWLLSADGRFREQTATEQNVSKSKPLGAARLAALCALPAKNPVTRVQEIVVTN